ncbi:MAG: hypothetical protein ABIB98_03110 [bacterium]
MSESEGLGVKEGCILNIFLKDSSRWLGVNEVWQKLKKCGNPIGIKKREIHTLIQRLRNSSFLVRSLYSAKYRPDRAVWCRLPPPREISISGKAVSRKRYPIDTTFVAESERKYG